MIIGDLIGHNRSSSRCFNKIVKSYLFPFPHVYLKRTLAQTHRQIDTHIGSGGIVKEIIANHFSLTSTENFMRSSEAVTTAGITCLDDLVNVSDSRDRWMALSPSI